MGEIHNETSNEAINDLKFTELILHKEIYLSIENFLNKIYLESFTLRKNLDLNVDQDTEQPGSSNENQRINYKDKDVFSKLSEEHKNIVRVAYFLSTSYC